MNITAFDLAQRFVGVKEVPGTKDNPMILSMLKLDGEWPQHDEVPWCSAFVNYICWLLRLPRSKSLAARSWLNVGQAVSLVGELRTSVGGMSLPSASVGYDVVILERPAAGPSAGHVGFFAGVDDDPDSSSVHILGGNQSNTVSVAPFPISRVIGIRRLA